MEERALFLPYYMKRLFSDFNNNIRNELLQKVDTKANTARIQKTTELLNNEKSTYLGFARLQGTLTRKLNNAIKKGSPEVKQLTEQRDIISDQRRGLKGVYESRKADLNKLLNKDFNVTIRLYQNNNSTKPEYREPLSISKEKLLTKSDPALYILTEQSKRIRHDLQEGGKELQRLQKNLFDLDFTELGRLKKLQSTQRGLKVLYQKALCGMLMQKNGTDFEETVEDNSELLEDLAEALEMGSSGSDSAPFFYVPLETSIDIL
jgi:hypothetical protein